MAGTKHMLCCVGPNPAAGENCSDLSTLDHFCEFPELLTNHCHTPRSISHAAKLSRMSHAAKINKIVSFDTLHSIISTHPLPCHRGWIWVVTRLTPGGAF